MISSKLILLFCFCILLPDNSLGQKTLLEQGKSKQLFKDAIEYGQTYGGEVGELGSQWKQLLIQLVHAKRNVGLGKVQLARFNDSATTEEVGLAVTDSYADKVAALIAIRSEDIGTDQKYIDELEILKNEIALTMIVEMERTGEEFKEENVRRKVKEAKENGITDTDIKELLFADFFDSQGGLSLIDKAASIAKALLSSFRKGIESILHETYYEKLGIIQYGNILGSLPFGDGDAAGGDSDADDNDAEGDDVAPGGARGGGGASGGGGGAGGGDSPSGPPGGGGGDDRKDDNKNNDDDDPKDDDEKDDDEKDDDEKYRNDINLFFDQFLSVQDQSNDTRGFSREQLANWRSNQPDVKDDEEEPETTFEEPAVSISRFSAQHLDEAVRLVNREMVARRTRIRTLENDTTILSRARRNGYFRDASLQEPQNPTNADILELYERRARHLQTLLNTAQLISDDNVNFRYQFRDDYYLARDNYYFYGSHVSLGESLIYPSRVPTSRPSRLPEFMYANDYSLTRFLISREHLNALINIGNRLRLLNIYLKGEISLLEKALDYEQRKIIYMQSKLSMTKS